MQYTASGISFYYSAVLIITYHLNPSTRKSSHYNEPFNDTVQQQPY